MKSEDFSQRWPHYKISPNRVPGATVILKETTPYKLQNLASTSNHPKQRRCNQEQKRGEKLHKILEKHFNGQNYIITQDIAGYWKSIQPVLAYIDDIRLVEGLIWHPYQFCGQPDCVGSYGNVPCIIEWKFPSIDSYQIRDNHYLQIAAYCAGVNRVYKDYGARINHAAIVIALPDNRAEFLWIKPPKLYGYWCTFQERLNQYWERKG